MTRRDYERLARAFARTRPAGEDDSYFAWFQVREAICDELAADNPRFSRPLFQRASMA